MHSNLVDELLFFLQSVWENSGGVSTLVSLMELLQDWNREMVCDFLGVLVFHVYVYLLI